MKKSMVMISAAFILMLMVAARAEGGSWVTGSVSNQFGSRNYKVWVPTGYEGTRAVPLIMMLHGCTQSPDDFAAGTQMNRLADEKGFLVVYPEQPSNANQSRCWNWFEPASQVRGSGEPSLLVAIVARLQGSYNIDPDRIYAAGLSAGAAMSVILGATYPDIFRAICVSAGLEYKAATSLNNAFTALNSGGPDANQQGVAAFQAMGAARRRVRVIVFHGASDFTVNTANGHQVLTQWAQTNDLVDDGSDNNSINDVPTNTINGTVTNGYNFTRTIYKDNSGQSVLEKWIVQSMGHAWSGGSTAGSFTDPKGPSASQELWRFFSETGSAPPPPPPAGDTTPPVLTVTPAGGSFDAMVNVNLSLNEAGTIYYTTDGSDPTVSGTRKSITNNGQLTIQNSLTLSVYAVDLAGNSAPIQAYSYTINHPETAMTFISVGTQDGYVAATVVNGTTGGYAVSSDVSVGDNADAPFRGILSFNTAAIPDGATILSAEVRLYYTLAPVGNPWTSHGFLVADIKNGCLGSGCTVAASDFEAVASLNEAVVFTAPASTGAAGTLVSGTLSAAALAHINKLGSTQLRLRFKNNSNNNGTSDYVTFAGGEYYLTQFRPVLVVKYK